MGPHTQQQRDLTMVLHAPPPKVAACICLFSLDKAAAVPVDTHVWQLATQHYLPHLRGARLCSCQALGPLDDINGIAAVAGKKPSKALNRVVEEALQERFGSHAGWAHNVLFISELAQMRALAARSWPARSSLWPRPRPRPAQAQRKAQQS